MDSDEAAELYQQFDVRSSQQSDFPDDLFLLGSQDSLSNVVPFDFNTTNSLYLSDQRSSGLCYSSHDQGSFSDLGNFPYRLLVSFESQITPVTKSAAWTYSEALKRLYVNMGQPCPINIKSEPRPREGFRLRCSLRYAKTSYANDPVVQCANHSAKEDDFALKGHILRSNEIGAQYEQDEQTGHCSILFSYDEIQDGVDKDTFVFEFKCRTSCVGRRAMKLVFALECSNQVLCSQTVDVRICSCPGRDRRHDEDHGGQIVQKVKKENDDISLCSLGTKRTRADDDEYRITVRGRRNYELLKALKKRLEKADAYDEKHAKGPDSVSMQAVQSVSNPVKELVKETEPCHSRSFGSSNSQYMSHLHHQKLQQSKKGKLVKKKSPFK